MVILSGEKLTDDLFKEIMNLATDHFNEVSSIFDKEEIMPDLELYKFLDNKGNFKMFTARLDKELIGYLSFFISINPHFSNVKQAQQDLLYIKPDERKGWLAKEIMEYAEKRLKDLEVDLIWHYSTVKKDISSLLKSMGYQLVQQSYLRRI